MEPIDANRLPNVLKTFPTLKEEPLDNSEYKNQVSYYLSTFLSKEPMFVTDILYRAFSQFFGKIWKELFADKESKGELSKISVVWWEGKSVHRSVDAYYYLTHWKSNYAELAENWTQVESDPENINKIFERIRTGIAGLLYTYEFEDAIYATLKYQQKTYQRQKNAFIQKILLKKHSPEDYPELLKLVVDITDYISTLPITDAINFLGELSGAYILSCPVDYVNSDPDFHSDSQKFKLYSSEELCTMVLLKYICAYGSQEFAMEAASFPLQLIKEPNQDWKFFVEIPA